MTDSQKTIIDALTEKGVPPADIATKLNISKNTIKSYIQRKKKVDVCLSCGKVLNHIPNHKKKKFCSDKCRMNWWNTHRSDMICKSAVKLQCQCCGKEFQDYSVKQRKYCSRECYIKMRYGGAENARISE